MSGLTAPTTEQLVSAAYVLRHTLAATERDLKEIEEQIIARGPGRHTGLAENEVVTVVAESVGKDKHELPDEAVARKLAGDNFAKLFDRHVIYTPCKSFADVVGKLLAKGPAAKIVALCTKPGQTKRAHCRYA